MADFKGGGDEGDGILPDIVQFAEIAQEFPNIRLKVVLEAEQHFRSVDVDGVSSGREHAGGT